MTNVKVTALTSLTSGQVDRATDVIEVADVSASQSKKITPNAFMGISGAAVGDTDTQTLSNKTITAPTISSPVLSGTVTGTYTIGGTPTFPSAVVTLTGSQTLTNKVLTSPTINTATIANPTLTVDSINEFTGSNGVTVAGLNIKSSKLNTNNSVVTSNLTNASVTADKLSTGATSAVVATAETTTSTSYVDLATVTDTVTVVVGANGILLISMNCLLQNSGANFSNMSFALSGTNTLAGADANAFSIASTARMSGAFLMTGLNAGSTTVKAKYSVSAGTGTFTNRRISAVPL